MTINTLALSSSALVNLIHTPINGLCKTLALEPAFSVKHCDIGDTTSASFEKLATELSCFDQEPEVALREELRLVSRLGLSESTVTPPIISSEGVYVITGGFGGIGLLVAEWLVNQGARSICLVGRSSPRSVAADKNSELRSRGARVFECVASVANPLEMKKIFSEVAEGTHIRGIIHSAGHVEDYDLDSLKWAAVERVYEAKVLGSWVLHTLSKECPQLDFFVLFSSMMSTFGSLGQLAHTSACSFQDGLTAYRKNS